MLQRPVEDSLRKEKCYPSRHHLLNCMKLRINAKDKSPRDNAIADGYGNKFIIPLDFEMLDSAAPYYQAGLRNRLCYEITFNDYNRVISSSVASPDATYKL